MLEESTNQQLGLLDSRTSSADDGLAVLGQPLNLSDLSSSWVR